MTNETSKQALRRSADRRYANRWFKGHGIDIGSGTDSLAALTSFFPLMESVRSWDTPDGDAMLMREVADNSFDFVHSSHCLEHLHNPVIGLRNWIRICKEDGYLIITVPDEDLYEQGVWPSAYNSDHKWTFTISKRASWSSVCISLTELLGLFENSIEIIKIELLDAGYQYGAPRFDQTRGAFAESAIEVVLKKKAAASAARDGSENAKVVSAAFLQALAYHQEGLKEQATSAYEAVLEIDQDHLASLNNLALLTDSDASEVLLRQALRRKPDYLDALRNLATVLRNQGKIDELEATLEHTIRLVPGFAPAYWELAQLQEKQSNFAAAIGTLQRLAGTLGESAEINYRIARLHEACNATEESLRHFDKALALEPNHRLSHIWKGFALLKKGDYRAGAADLAWIYGNTGCASKLEQSTSAEGTSQPLAGMSVVLSADSGLGDMLQFVRYAEVLKTKGANVIVECQQELIRLVEGGVASVDQVVKVGELRSAFDLRIPVTEAICVFGTTLETIPNRVPYIIPPKREKILFVERLSRFRGLKVGLVWAGNGGHWANSRRSINLSLLAPLAKVDNVVLLSLQKEAAGVGLDLVDWTEDLHDMADTAALVSSLDVVISVDSAVAHLAGALGRPVWLLNRYDSCWRWLEDRSDSPWYPTMRIFRQRRPNDWSSVVEEVTRCLAARASVATELEVDVQPTC